MSHLAYIGLGSNLSDPVTQVRTALSELEQIPGLSLIAHSRLYQSAPLGYRDQPNFINAVAALTTELSPELLLVALRQLEAAHSRQRTWRNAPRTLDLDLLLYDGLQIDSYELTLPHPRMGQRAFVLRPLQELTSAELLIPGQGTLATLLQDCQDQEAVILPEPPGSSAIP